MKKSEVNTPASSQDSEGSRKAGKNPPPPAETGFSEGDRERFWSRVNKQGPKNQITVENNLKSDLESILAICEQVREANKKMTPGPWKSFGAQAVVITDAKSDQVTREVLEQGRIIFGSPGWTDDESENRIPDEEEVDNCDGTALLRNVCPALAETTRATINQLRSLPQDFRNTGILEHHAERILQSIADTWRKAGLI